MFIESTSGDEYSIQVPWCKQHYMIQRFVKKGTDWRNGYAFILKEDLFNPLLPKYRSEHRAVMEMKLGRKLQKGESVHHKNGIKDDNRPENLELWVGPIRAGQRGSQVKCPHCGKSWIPNEQTEAQS